MPMAETERLLPEISQLKLSVVSNTLVKSVRWSTSAMLKSADVACDVDVGHLDGTERAIVPGNAQAAGERDNGVDCSLRQCPVIARYRRGNVQGPAFVTEPASCVENDVAFGSVMSTFSMLDTI